MIRRPPRSTQSRSSAASDVYKRQVEARTVDAIAGAAGLLERLPALVHNLERMVSIVVSEGLQLDDEVIGALRELREADLLISVPIGLIALALLAIAAAVWEG